MSEVIDSRVVEMRFDNSQFESNVRESLKTIDNLKSSLNFEDSVKGLDKLKFDIDASGAVKGINAISDAASECDLSALNDSADSVKLSFSALEVVAVTALGKIASAAIDAGAKAVKAFVIQPITDGFEEYNQQLKSTRVITSNTGQSLEEITRVLDDLNLYADKTIYSFGDMTQAMGYFTSALGKNSAEASATIAKGISNWAASTGQGNQVAKRVMYQVSQALSTGMFRLQDWKSIENTGAMAGKRYQEAFIETAAEMYGFTTEEFSDYIEREYGSFRESLTKGEWLTNDVFLETMRKFANETDILNEKGERAFQWMEDAATKVLTFGDLMDTVREQIGTGWGETWKIVFGDFKQSENFFTGISKKIGDFITHVNDARNAIFSKWSENGGRNLLFGISEDDTGAIGKILDGIINLLSQVHDAFINAFGTDFLGNMLYGASEVISKIADGFERFTSIPIVYSALGSVFSIIKSIISVISDLYKIVEPFVGFVLSVVEKILQGIGKVAEVIANGVNIVSEKFSSLTSHILEPFQIASQFITDTFGKALDFIVDKISSMWNWLKKFDIFGIMGGDEVEDVEKDFSDHSIEEANTQIETLNKDLEEANTQIGTLNKGLEETERQSREVTGTWWDLVSESDKSRYFMAEYWDELSEEQKESWKQYALGLKLFTEEELTQLENAEKSVDDILNNRDRIAQRKKDEAQTWWDLIDDAKKQQYFAPQFWDDLTDEQREAWRKRAEAYNLYDPEEYARLLAEIDAAEQAAFSSENTEDVADSATEIENWVNKASKLPVVGGVLEKFGWIATKTAKNAKSFASAAKTSFGGFIDFVKVLNGTDLTFFQKFQLASTYFKDHVVDYLGELVVKNFKSIGTLISNSDIVNKISSFTTSIRDRFSNFKKYVSDLNKNVELTFPEKFKLSLDYFKTNVIDYFGELVGGKLKEIGTNLSDNKIVSNLISLTQAAKTKFGEFREYVGELNSNTELTFPEKFRMSIEFLKTNVIDYFMELINKNLKSVGIDLEQIGKDISKALENAANFIDQTLNKLGVDTESIRKFFWNDDGTLKSIPEVISALGAKIEQAFDEIKKNLRAKYEEFFPSTEEGELTGPLGWLVNVKKKVDDFVSSIFGSADDVDKKDRQTNKGGLLAAALGVLGLTGGPSIMKSIGNMNTLFSFGKNLGISGGLSFGKVALGVGLAAGAFGLLSKVDFSKLGIDFKGFTDYFKDGEGNLLSVSEIFGKVGESISNSNIGKWVSNTSQLIGKNVSTAFDLFKEKTIFFGDFIKVLNESDLTFPQKFSLATRFFKDHFIVPFGELTKKNLKTIGIDIDGFLGKFKNTEGDWLSIGDIFAKAGNKISAVIEEQKAKFEKTAIGQWISEKLEKFKTNYSEIFDWFGSVGKTISESGAVKWIGDTAKLIGQNASTAFTLFGEKMNLFKEHLKVLNDDTEMTFPQKFKAAFDFFKEDVVKPFEELAKNNLKTIGIDLDTFFNYFKNNEGDWLSISELIEKIGNKIHDAFENLKKNFTQSAFGQWVDDKLTWLRSKFDSSSNWLENFSKILSRVALPVIGGAGFVLALRRIGQMFDFIQSIGQRMSGRTPIDTANAFSIRVTSLAGAIRDAAVAVVMIAGALAGLSMLDQDNLAKASESLSRITNVIRDIAIVFGVASFFTSKKETGQKALLALVEIAGTLFLVATAFKIVTTIPLSWDLVGHILILGALMAATAGLAKYASGIEGSESSFLGMIGIATAVLEMVGALYLVQLMLESHQGIGWALLTLVGLVGTFSLLCTAVKGVDWKAGIGLYLMARSVRTMLDSLEYLLESDILTKFGSNWEEIRANILKIALVFGSLAALSYINKLSGGGKAGLNLLGVAASVWILVQAIESIAEISTDELIRATVVVGVLTFVVGAIMVAYSALNNGNATSLRSMIATTVQLYAVVTAVLLLCAAIAALSFIDQTQLITAGAVVGGLTFVVGAISVLMAAFGRKSNFGKSLKHLAVATSVAVAMGALIWALDHFIPDKSNLLQISKSVALLAGVMASVALLFGKFDIDLGSAFKGALAIGFFGVVVEALAGLAGALYEVQGENIEKVITLIGRIGKGIAKMFSSLMTSLGKLSWGKIIAVLAVAAGSIKAAAAYGLPIALGVSAIVGIVGLVVEGLITLAAIIYDWKGETIEKVVSLIGRMGRGLAEIFDSLMSTIGKLSWQQLVGAIGLAVVPMVALGGFGGVVGFNLGLFAVEMAVAAVIVTGLLDFTLPVFEKFANDGVPIFEKIASGIVEIASIIINGIVSNVETIIDCLKSFTDFASSGFDSEKVGQAVGIASQLVTVVGAFVGDDFLSMLGKFIGEKLFGETNREAFSANIGCLTGVLNDFTSNIATWTETDLEKTQTATDIADQLTTICNKFSEDDLLTAFGNFIENKLFGEANREAFKSNIITLGVSLAAFCACINAIPDFDATKADSAIGVADKMIDLVNKFTPENVLSALDTFITNKVFGGTNLTDFKDNITKLSEAVETFCTSVNSWTVPSNYYGKFKIVDKMIEFVGKMPELTETSGLMDIGDFGTSVNTFCTEFVTATNSLNEALGTTEIKNYEDKMTLIDNLIELAKKLPDTASTMEQFIGYNVTQSFSQFGTDISSFGGHLKSFAEAMNGVPKIKRWEDNKTVIGDLVEFANLLPKKNSAGEEVFGYDLATSLGDFGSQIFSLASSFKLAVDKINEINIEEGTLKKFGQMKSMVGMLINLAKDLPQSFTMADASGNSDMITSTFTQSLSEFMDDIIGDKGLMGGYSNTIFDQVQRVYDELDELGDFDENNRRGKLESLVGDDGVLRKLSSFANDLPDVTADSTTLSTFGQEIYELANHVSDAVQTLNGDDTSGVYAFDPEPLRKLGEGIQNITSSFTGISTEDLGHISSILDSIETLKSGEGKSIGQLLKENIINSLFDIPEGDINQAITNSGSITELLGGLGGIGELINGIAPEGGFNLTGISDIFGTMGPDGTSSGGILSLIPASLTQFSTDVPDVTSIKTTMTDLMSAFSAENIGNVDFSGTEPLFGVFNGGAFDETGFLSTLPKEIQTYVTSMTGGEEGFDLTAANQVITDLASGVSEAGSITPDLAQNFNDTLTAFANNGISAYVDAFNTEETNTKLNDAGKAIVDKTGAGITTALSFLPNALQTASKSAVQFVSDILSGDETNPYNIPGESIIAKTASGIELALGASSAFLQSSVNMVVDFITSILAGDETNPYNAPGESIIIKTASGIEMALGSQSSFLQSSVKLVVDFIANILSGNDGGNAYESTGSSIIVRTSNGITSALGSYSYSLTSAARSIVDVVTTALSDNYDSYVSAGNNVVSGFIAGMSDTSGAYNAAYSIGQAAVSGLSDAINSNSPSKEAMKYGEYFGEGFEIGIDSYGSVVKNASENVGNEALLGIASYVGRVYELLDSDLDVNPRITPVLDLSEIQNGVGLVDALFSRQQAYSTNMEVNGAVRARSEAMRPANLTTDNSRNFGGFTFNIYPQGSDAATIAREIGVEVSKKLRSTGKI